MEPNENGFFGALNKMANCLIVNCLLVCGLPSDLYHRSFDGCHVRDDSEEYPA